MELPQGPRTQATIAPSKLRATSFFPMRKLMGKQPSSKMPMVHLAHLEEEDASSDEDQDSDNPGRIEGVTEELMVCLARAVKDTQVDEKCCYHCSSLDHFICNCPLVKTLREKGQLNGKEGMTMKKEARTPPMKANMSKSPQEETREV